MKEPIRIPLTDSPRTKNVKTIPLKSDHQYDIEMIDDIYHTSWKIHTVNEDNSENNPSSIQKLESDETN